MRDKRWFSFLIPIVLVFIGIVFFIIHFIEINKGQLVCEIDSNQFVMPATYKVHSNNKVLDGKYYLFKMLLHNNYRKTLRNVVVKYNIPGYIEWTELCCIGKLSIDQNVSLACFPKFDPSIVEKTTQSVESVNIQISWDGINENEVIEKSFTFDMLSVNDFAYTSIDKDELISYSDMIDNRELLACYVTPDDPVIQYYTSLIQSELLKGDQAAVSKSEEDAVRALFGIYEMTRQMKMVYSGAKGLPKEAGDVTSLIQNIRLPREVVTGNTGLCIELSLLYSSVLSRMGLNPVIFLVPGHAYPGVELNGIYYAIEATGISGEGLGYVASFEEAFTVGMQNLEVFFNEYLPSGTGFILDINYLHSIGILPMELDDDQFCKNKIDDIYKNKVKFSNNCYANVYSTYSNTSDQSQNRESSNAKRFSGTFSFDIPTQWITNYSPNPYYTTLTAVVTSPDQIVSINVFDIPANSIADAMNYLYIEFANNGTVLQYSIQGQNLSGYTFYQNSSSQWVGKIGKVKGGYRLIAISVNTNYYNSYIGVIEKIYNSIR
ncbi:MAG TPA: hypothetical protein P5538_09655 [Bacteroidales bacterium]|mgnify:CR=1 FL=1|nr:hypothetical protein [Bacteroidales bacterium]HRS99848.1 hypothetical protein [Bacteroidales bacterium]HRT81191.1 hypothetical protein [Bacteroidales bacterium]